MMLKYNSSVMTLEEPTPEVTHIRTDINIRTNVSDVAPPCFVKYSSDQPYWGTIGDDVEVQLVCDDSRGTNPRGDTYTNRYYHPNQCLRCFQWKSEVDHRGPQVVNHAIWKVKLTIEVPKLWTMPSGTVTYPSIQAETQDLRNPRCAETSIPQRWGLPGCHWYNDQWKMSGRYKTRWERHTTLSCLSIIQLLMITPFECIL
jgi:hypothetical protein